MSVLAAAWKVDDEGWFVLNDKTEYAALSLLLFRAHYDDLDLTVSSVILPTLKFASVGISVSGEVVQETMFMPGERSIIGNLVFRQNPANIAAAFRFHQRVILEHLSILVVMPRPLVPYHGTI